MDLGMVGLGRMGANMAERLRLGGHRVVAYDRDPQAVSRTAKNGITGAASLSGLVAALTPPRAIWVMVPAGAPVEATLADLGRLLVAGDAVLDGGNSNYRDTLRRHETLEAAGIHLVDVGTSGGIWGLAEGYSLMIGGDADVVSRLRPLFESLAPAPDRGWGRVGPAGSGHFVKMVHNGIEYGLMQAYAEGFSVLAHKEEFALDLHQVSEIWRHGSVVRSWLLDLASDALAENPRLDGIDPYVVDSGEGRWTVDEALDLGVPAPAITASLVARLRSRDRESFADRLLSVLRGRFGGHEVRKKGPDAQAR